MQAKPSRREGFFRCDVCGENGFHTQKALQQHARVVHKQRCVMNFYVSGSKCPCCRREFADRLRVIAHLSDPRNRAKVVKATCRDKVLAGDVPRLADDVVAKLDEEARIQRAKARRAGHTRPVVPTHLQASKRKLGELISLPSRRVRHKTSPAQMEWRMKKPRQG